MDISLSPELAKFLDEKVRSGRYKDAREVIDEGLRLLKLRDDTLQTWREQIDQGWSEAQAGNLIDGPEAMDALIAEADVLAEVDRNLRAAIEGLHTIEIETAGRTRIGEPHDYGVMNGKLVLLLYQTGGYSRSGGLPQWRHILVTKITAVHLLDETFRGGRKTKKSTHRRWQKVISRASA
jgi:putative addiction module CopG family antidote